VSGKGTLAQLRLPHRRTCHTQTLFLQDLKPHALEVHPSKGDPLGTQSK
jgi:hypothetical protein